MPAPIDGNGFEAEIERGQMGRVGDDDLAQDRSGKQPAELGRMLQHRQFVPSIEGNNRLQYRRQFFGLPRHTPPPAAHPRSQSRS